MDEIPIFPGIPVEKLIGKKFETLALHLHRIVDGRMKQNFHIEDWQTAVDQMVNDKPPPDFGLDRGYLNFKVPEAVEKFYDKILSNPQCALHNFQTNPKPQVFYQVSLQLSVGSAESWLPD